MRRLKPARYRRSLLVLLLACAAVLGSSLLAQAQSVGFERSPAGAPTAVTSAVAEPTRATPTAATPTLARPTVATPAIATPANATPVTVDRVETEHLVARLIAESAAVAPGGTVELALVFDIRPGWHTYWRNPGDSGEPPRIDWTLPDGVRAGPIRWPYPELIRVGPLANYGYSGRAVHLVRLSVPDDWPVGQPIELAADASWLVCAEHCIPEDGRFSLRLAVPAARLDRDGQTRNGDEIRSERAQLFAEARSAIPGATRIAARLERRGPMMRLRVPAAALPPAPSSVRFFAEHWGLIEHAAPQPWRLQDDQLVMTLTPGAASASSAPTGLLVIDAPGGTRALRIDAAAQASAESPSEVLAGPADGTLRHQGSGSDSAQAVAGSLALPVALGFALIGGLILNLMPCVFPVLAIKALALAQQGETGLQQRALHGAAYTAGVLALFGCIALLLLALRAGGAALGWGFQLQSPVFVALMGYLFLTLGLSFSGAVTLGVGLIGVGGSGPQYGYLGAFATGALAALVAAPCTAPFMGAAVGYAIAQPWPVALAVILTLGLGMALPLVALMLSPTLARRLPRPGPWMEYLKQFLAFPMLATAAWLLWVLSQQAGSAGVGAALAGALLLSLGLWLLELTGPWAARWRWLGRAGFTAALVAALWLAAGLGGGLGTSGLRTPDGAATGGGHQQSGPAFEPFSARRLAAARDAERPVFVNMTAAWCITCLVNERVALARPAVVSAFAERGILYLKGDWTNRNAAITDYLADYGRNGVPLYVYYPPGGKPTVLPQVLSESIVLSTLEE